LESYAKYLFNVLIVIIFLLQNSRIEVCILGSASFRGALGEELVAMGKEAIPWIIVMRI
jgi:hypothetical protein